MNGTRRIRVSGAMRAVGAVAGTVAFALAPARTEAQESAVVLSGVVRDSAGTPIAGAEVRVAQTGYTARSDERGEFLLMGLYPGRHAIHVRRLGFRPESTSVGIGAESPGPLVLQLRPIAAQLPAVVVTRRRVRHTGRLAGFFERLESGTSGQFLTRDMIDLGNTRTLTNLLQRIPGVEVVRGGQVRLRGRRCGPLVWLDGTEMPAGEVNLDTFAPQSLEGVEVYMSSMNAPARYQGTRDNGACGTIILWSRDRESEERRRPRVALAAQIEQLLAEGQVHTAAEVDRQSLPPDPQALGVVYPPELLAGGVAGVVVAELVVDTTGRAEPATFGVLASPHPLFTAAVQDAVQRATFTVAERAGRRVRQLVQLRFIFELPANRQGRR